VGEAIYNGDKTPAEEINWIMSPQRIGMNSDELDKVSRDSWSEFHCLLPADILNFESALEAQLDVRNSEYEHLNKLWEANPSDRNLRLAAGSAWVKRERIYERLEILRIILRHRIEVGPVPSYDEWNGAETLSESANYKNPYLEMGKAAVDTFRIGYCLTRTEQIIPGPKGTENQTSILTQIAKLRNVGLSAVQEHAKNHEWIGPDMRDSIAKKAETIDPEVLENWEAEWKK